MKIQQVQYVLEIYNTGSISKAAKNLYLSQPNISNAVKKLEEELGFVIFTRSNSGITFTEKGMDLVRHARSVVDHMGQIKELATQESNHRFFLVSPRYTPVDYAFARLCAEYQSKERFHFMMRNATQYEGIDMLYQNECDMVVVVSNNINSVVAQSTLKNKNLKYTQIASLQCNVNLSKNHPLLKEKVFNFGRLWDYSYISYRNMEVRWDPFANIGPLEFVNPNKRVDVDAREMRSLIVTNSNAFSIGIALPPKRVEELGWESVPIPGVTMDFGYIISGERPLSSVSRRYLELMEEESGFLFVKEGQE